MSVMSNIAYMEWDSKSVTFSFDISANSNLEEKFRAELNYNTENTEND